MIGVKTAKAMLAEWLQVRKLQVLPDLQQRWLQQLGAMRCGDDITALRLELMHWLDQPCGAAGQLLHDLWDALRQERTSKEMYYRNSAWKVFWHQILEDAGRRSLKDLAPPFSMDGFAGECRGW